MNELADTSRRTQVAMSLVCKGTGIRTVNEILPSPSAGDSAGIVAFAVPRAASSAANKATTTALAARPVAWQWAERRAYKPGGRRSGSARRSPAFVLPLMGRARGICVMEGLASRRRY